MKVCVRLASAREMTEPALRAAGGKARSLARLAEAGLPVPAAFAVTDALYRALRAGGPALPRQLQAAGDLQALQHARSLLLAAPFPAGFLSELDARLDELDELAGPAGAPGASSSAPRFAVRSSFMREDAADGLGAGVYESLIGVARADVADAIRQVLASALSPSAVAYAHLRGEDPDRDAGAVLVHRYLPGEASGSAAWDPAGGGPPTVETVTGALSPAARAAVDRAVRALGARQGAVEIEWVAEGGAVIFLQLRRYQPPPPASGWSGAAELGDGDWRWDAAHNPLPLSPAQAGLIALVTARCPIGIRQRVVGGYLFFAGGGPPPARRIAAADVEDEFSRLGVTVERALVAPSEAPPPAGTPACPLEAALELFVAMYEPLFGVIQPALRRSRQALADFLGQQLPDAAPAIPWLLGGVDSIASERRWRAERLAGTRSAAARAIALAEYLARFGDESAAWDVEVPTYREDPSSLLAWLPPVTDGPAPPPPASSPPSSPAPDWRDAARAIEDRLPAPGRAVFADLLAQARTAAAIGEDDDFLYARVQAAVRAAILRQGEGLVRAGLLVHAGDLFQLPLDLIRGLARGGAVPARAELAALLAAAREQRRRWLHDPPQSGASSARGTAGLVHGRRASAGRVIGRAFVYSNAHSNAPAPDEPGAGQRAMAPGADSILVAATLLPTELPLLQAAGLVVETGGALGHVAAQARERGIPAIVAATGACAAIATGDLVLLDADAGVVIKLISG